MGRWCMSYETETLGRRIHHLCFSLYLSWQHQNVRVLFFLYYYINQTRYVCSGLCAEAPRYILKMIPQLFTSAPFQQCQFFRAGVSVKRLLAGCQWQLFLLNAPQCCSDMVFSIDKTSHGPNNGNQWFSSLQPSCSRLNKRNIRRKRNVCWQCNAR